MSSERQLLGQLGEEIAANHLRQAGWEIIERNFRVAAGEIDIVAERLLSDGMGTKRQVAIVEVKCRRLRPGMVPEHQVTSSKRKRLIQLAKIYTKLHRIRARIRFDVIAIDWTDEEDYELRHHEGAFDAQGRIL